MDVQLYVYDLSKGLARQMSGAFLGVQIDAVYHTALVFGGIEYFFGAGVQTCYPGATHHGKPMEVISMGRTELPIEIILEYLESLKEIYTAETYDLFLHNCNNFSNDFAMFLVGKGIPDHITSLPQTVLDTPFGQMLKPQLDSAMRGITQAPLPPLSRPSSQRQAVPIVQSTSSHSSTNGLGAKHYEPPTSTVHNITKLADLESLLSSARKTCAVIFFTSSTCAPCKIVYPAYDDLAAEAGRKAVLIKVDINQAHEISAKYKVRVTPTFMTYLKGEKENEWSGANEGQLRGNVRLLVQMAHPPHPHSKLRLPTLQRVHQTPVTYSKMPPLDKLISKMGPLGTDPAVTALKTFITTRQSSGAADAPLPSLPQTSAFIQHSLETVPPPTLFPVIDLLRLALIDPRVSGYFASEPSHPTIEHILSFPASLNDSCPYTLRLVTIHLACNLFTSPIFPPLLLTSPHLSTPILTLLTTSLLDTTHPPIRVAAASLAFNIAAFNHCRRLEGGEELLPESAQVELVAGLLEAVGREEESREGVRGLLLAVGLLVYGAEVGGEVVDACGALGAKEIVRGKRGRGFGEEVEGLVGEVELVV